MIKLTYHNKMFALFAGIGCKVHKLNHIADNKSFLEEEMDTLIVLKEFENRGVPIDIDVHDGDRIFRARYIINKALSDERIAKTLYKVLSESEMTNVTDRFLQYETVYGSGKKRPLPYNFCIASKFLIV